MDMEKLEASAQPSHAKQILRKPNGSASEKEFRTSDETPRTSDEEIKLTIGNKSIMAEKQTLIENSPYFASLLKFHDGSMKAVDLIPPDNVNVANFLAVLYTLSNPSVKLNINASNLWDFVVLSAYFQLDEMENECFAILRKLLPTLGMDELCCLWRSGNAYAFDKVTSLVLAAISLKMECAVQSREFLDLTAAELLMLLSDDGFLPLMEEDVRKAVIAWFEHDPENRKKPQIVSSVCAQVVWNASMNDLPFASLRGEPGEAPKRAITSECHEDPSLELLAAVGCDIGIVIGDCLYGVEGVTKDKRVFHRINLASGERTPWDDIRPTYESDEEAAQYRFCLVKLHGRDHIAFLLSSWMDINYQYYGHGFRELVNTMGLYDTEKEEWTFLPYLPLPRIDTAMIQCGTFLYIVGGTEYQAYQAGAGNAHHCYRLDLSYLTTRLDENCQGQWERIADLNSPRVEHSVQIENGRIVVHGGQTETGVDEEGDKTFEDARWSEAYDTVLNTWTVFGSSS